MHYPRNVVVVERELSDYATWNARMHQDLCDDFQRNPCVHAVGSAWIPVCTKQMLRTEESRLVIYFICSHRSRGTRRL